MIHADPFRLSEWEIKKFVRFILIIQVSAWGILAWSALGINVSFVRPVLLFVYLTYVPGALLLRILGVRDLGRLETFLYTVGLSVATLMVIGLAMNTVYPLFGMEHPITELTVIGTISSFVLVTCALCYVRDDGSSNIASIETNEVSLNQICVLCIIILLSISGATLFTSQGDNRISLLSLAAICLVATAIGFGKFIPPRLYPIGILVIGVALLLQNSLVSNYLWGWDIQIEYYTSHVVVTNSYWNPAEYGSLNGMLAVVMLPPFFSLMTGLDLIWVLKLIYPLVFSLVPLGLYCVYRRVTNDRIAFLSTFFFISFYTFYGEMIMLARQEIAELFFVLVMMLLIKERMRPVSLSVLLITFSFSLIVSHYGLSYYFMISLFLVLIFSSTNQLRMPRLTPSKSLSRLAFLFFVLAIAWYTFVSGSASFIDASFLVDHIRSAFLTEFLNPASAQGLAIIIEEPNTMLHAVTKYLHFATQLLLLIGFFSYVRKGKGTERERLYASFGWANLLLLAATVAVPFVGSSFNTSRLYQISLLFLAPFCVIGGMLLLSKAIRAMKSFELEGIRVAGDPLKAIVVFLAVFFLFNSGFVYEIARDVPTSFTLDRNVDGPIFNSREVSAAQWLMEERGPNFVFVDGYRWLLISSFDWGNARILTNETNQTQSISYIFLGTLNTVEGKFLSVVTTGTRQQENYVPVDSFTEGRSRICDNGGAQIFY